VADRQLTSYTAALTAGSDPVDPPQPPPPAPPICGAYTDAAHFIAVDETKGYTYDASGANPKETRSVFSYDSYGNVTRETHYGDTANPADDYLVDRAFFANANAWIVDRMQWQRIFAGNVRTADGTEQAMAAYGYDGLALFTGIPVNGNLTTAAVYHTISASYTDPANFFTATTQYDSLGRPTVSTDANGRSTTTRYHSVYGYAETVSNALGACGQQRGGPRHGQPAARDRPQRPRDQPRVRRLRPAAAHLAAGRNQGQPRGYGRGQLHAGQRRRAQPNLCQAAPRRGRRRRAGLPGELALLRRTGPADPEPDARR
jgi:YD repeat-containing protein